MKQGVRKAGYTTVGLAQATEAQALPSNTSAQKAELIALTSALQLGKGQRVNIYTDTKYPFLVSHVRAATWEERGLLTTNNTLIKYGKEIVTLLQAVLESLEVAVFTAGHTRTKTG